MRNLLTIAFALAIAVGGSASGEQFVNVCPLATLMGDCPPKLEVDLNASIAPRKLPKHDLTPIALRIEGSVGHDDGGQPSALREVILDIDKDLQLNAGGIPACQASGRAIRSLHLPCPRSVVGKGQARIAIASLPEPATVKLTLLNGGVRDGKRLLYVYSLLNVPVPAALVAVVTIAHRGDGLHTMTEIPKIAGGSGSILDFHLAIRRTFAKAKGRRGYLEAKCPDDIFKISIPKILFKNETQTPRVPASTQMKGSLALPCISLSQ
jgi:hypothetical protein